MFRVLTHPRCVAKRRRWMPSGVAANERAWYQQHVKLERFDPDAPLVVDLEWSWLDPGDNIGQLFISRLGTWQQVCSVFSIVRLATPMRLAMGFPVPYVGVALLLDTRADRPDGFGHKKLRRFRELTHDFVVQLYARWGDGDAN